MSPAVKPSTHNTDGPSAVIIDVSANVMMIYWFGRIPEALETGVPTMGGIPRRVVEPSGYETTALVERATVRRTSA